MWFFPQRAERQRLSQLNLEEEHLRTLDKKKKNYKIKSRRIKKRKGREGKSQVSARSIRFTAEGSIGGHFISFCYYLTAAQKTRDPSPLRNNALILIRPRSVGCAFSAPRETGRDPFPRRINALSHSSPTLEYLMGCAGSVCCLSSLERARRFLLSLLDHEWFMARFTLNCWERQPHG